MLKPFVGNVNGESFTYTFHGDPRATFAQFFGNTNPFQDFFGFENAFHTEMDSDDPFTSFFSVSRSNRGSPKQQDPPLEHDLYISLEDILHGCAKNMKITRKVVKNNRVEKEDKILSVTVKPGWKAGTKVTFPKEGDQGSNTIPADVVFVIRDKPHPHFKRDGSDVRYTANVTLRQALCGCTINVPLLGGGMLLLDYTDEIITPNTLKRLSDFRLRNAKSAAGKSQ
ncbi:hypothetical protein NQ318_016123 [Aromia moschata]|uniref:Chaperone DnaJ C-terminal domain-containing protein n=1 Tax=Aromia moschata TaxID=1265417 RepID=A0AAV8Y0A5_9CUCU|nr:hypothetical protein NQ318_016123 [Aromia moschata]